MFTRSNCRHRITAYKYLKYIELDEARYVTKFESPPFELDLKARFEVDRIDDNSSVLRVIQTEFPVDKIADEFYKAWEKGWHDTFEGVRKFIDPNL